VKDLYAPVDTSIQNQRGAVSNKKNDDSDRETYVTRSVTKVSKTDKKGSTSSVTIDAEISVSTVPRKVPAG
jgi:hypothetical protein